MAIFHVIFVLLLISADWYLWKRYGYKIYFQLFWVELAILIVVLWDFIAKDIIRISDQERIISDIVTRNLDIAFIALIVIILIVDLIRKVR